MSHWKVSVRPGSRVGAPYPTVVAVVKNHQKEWKIDLARSTILGAWGVPIITWLTWIYYIISYFIIFYYRRKFRSQTSDNMDRWKAEMGRVREEKRREEERSQKRECLRRKKIQVREKVGKSRNTLFFQWFVAPEGRKVGSLKRRVRSQLARWEMKNCTPLWREAHLQVKKLKKNLTFRALLEVEMSKKCTPL